jgi:hypothetical protein
MTTLLLREPRAFRRAFGLLFLAASMAAPPAGAQESESPPIHVVDFSNPEESASRGPDTEGLLIEFFGNTNHIGGAEDRDPGDPEQSIFVGENGPGGTLIFAYGFTPSFPLRLAFSGAEHNTTDPDVDVGFSSVTIEGGYIFRAGTSVRPYVYGGAGVWALRSRFDEFDYETTGPGIDMGLGLYSFIGNHFVVDVALRFDFVNWENQTASVDLGVGNTAIVETPVREEGAASKILLGAGWWF